MMQLLPTGTFGWVNPKDYTLDYYSKDTPIGYFFEVDHNYPDELHDYPLVGKNLEVKKRNFLQLSVTNQRR